VVSLAVQAVPSSVSVSEKDWDKWQRDRGLPELLLPLQGQGALVQQKRQHGGGQQPDLPPRGDRRAAAAAAASVRRPFGL